VGEEAGEEEEAAYDEHVWTSPQNAVRIVEAITDTLCRVDGANADFYRQNSANYTAELRALDAAFQAVVDGAKRKTLVFGDRFPFRYFADRYGLAYFAAFPGCSTETEASAATVAFLIDKIRSEKIPVVFHIELGNERMADTIAEETGAEKLLLHACHNITKKDFENGVTYVDLMRQNVENLRRALQ
jgi:zinc transport system substrate-binding protein